MKATITLLLLILTFVNSIFFAQSNERLHVKYSEKFTHKIDSNRNTTVDLQCEVYFDESIGSLMLQEFEKDKRSIAIFHDFRKDSVYFYYSVIGIDKKYNQQKFLLGKFYSKLSFDYLKKFGSIPKIKFEEEINTY